MFQFPSPPTAIGGRSKCPWAARRCQRTHSLPDSLLCVTFQTCLDDTRTDECDVPAFLLECRGDAGRRVTACCVHKGPSGATWPSALTPASERKGVPGRTLAVNSKAGVGTPLTQPSPGCSGATAEPGLAGSGGVGMPRSPCPPRQPTGPRGPLLFYMKEEPFG